MPTLYCPKCGYNLSNLQENRCPECGKAFDPDSLLKRQADGISTRSVALQLIFLPVGFAVFAPMCLIATIDTNGAGIVLGLLALFGAILAHGYFLARTFVRARKLRHGEDNVPWLFRHAWACCILFTTLETVLTFMYFAGGCALIISSMSFH